MDDCDGVPVRPTPSRVFKKYGGLGHFSGICVHKVREERHVRSTEVAAATRTSPFGRGASARGLSSWAIARIFLLLQMVIVVVVCCTVGLLMLCRAQSAAEQRATDITRAESATLAQDPFVIQQVTSADPSAGLQPYVSKVVNGSSVSFVTIMSPEGIRYTHPDESNIGQHYLGDISRAQRGETMTVKERGTLGMSMRTIMPIRDDHGTVVGLVSTGVTVTEISATVRDGLPAIGLFAGILLVTTTLTTVLLYRYLHRATLGYSQQDILNSEATRSMAQMLRIQNHEHRNRMHTVVSLLDLGRTTEARQFAREDLESTGRHMPSWGSYEQLPAVAALLSGKAREAKERGIELTVRVDGHWDAIPLSEIELVTVVSNLVDNAVDAVTGSTESGTVEVELSETDAGWDIVVADNGPGVSDHDPARIFSWGYSTKPTGPEGRGLGLALVRDTLAQHGASIDVFNDAGAVFTVVIPRSEERRSR